jgi:hypothetical protein
VLIFTERVCPGQRAGREIQSISDVSVGRLQPATCLLLLSHNNDREHGSISGIEIGGD